MSYRRHDDRSLEPLPQRSVDTGMGLERLLMVVQGRPSVFDCDVFQPWTTALPTQRPGSRTEGRFSYAEVSRSLALVREPLAGTTVHTFPGTPGHLLAGFPQFKSMTRPFGLRAILILFRLTSEKPVVRTHLRPPSLYS